MWNTPRIESPFLEALALFLPYYTYFCSLVLFQQFLGTGLNHVIFFPRLRGVTLDDLRSALKESEILEFDEEAGRIGGPVI